MDVSAKSRAVDAFDRLAAGLFEYPAEVLHGYVQEAKDRNRTRAELAAVRRDHALTLLRTESKLETLALENQLNELRRRQANRDAIAIGAAEELKALPPPQSNEATGSSEKARSHELPEDWLNIFVGHAEKASSEDMQQLWSRILAGEIRRPGSFSLTTLRVMSEMDQEIAQRFESVAAHRLDAFIPYESPRSGEILATLTFLEDAGLIYGAADELGYKRQMDDNGRVFFQNRNLGLCVTGEPGAEFRIHGIFLTRAGKQLATLIAQPAPDAALRRLVPFLKQGKTIELFEVKTINDQSHVGRTIEVLKSNPPAKSDKS